MASASVDRLRAEPIGLPRSMRVHLLQKRIGNGGRPANADQAWRKRELAQAAIAANEVKINALMIENHRLREWVKRVADCSKGKASR